MGGSGSGRSYYLGARRTVDGCLAVDINQWNRDGLLRKGRRFLTTWTGRGGHSASISVAVHEDFVSLSYTANGKPVNYDVDLTFTECNYGGQRPWFECPKCYRRVGKLYSVNGYFLCRHCHDLTYASAQDSGKLLDKEIRTVERLRRKLGAKGSETALLTWFEASKPKGMHWKTYFKLHSELRQAEAAASGSLQGWIKHRTSG